VFAFDNMEKLVSRTSKLLENNRKLALDFLKSHNELECFIPEHGTTLFPRLKHGSVDTLASLLETKYDTMIVPGRFFEMPEHFRLGLGISTEMMREGLKRLGEAMDEIATSHSLQAG
jgi:aspartate/methionine/tyrosine aminotransferase